MPGRPLDVLEESLESAVTVHLKDGRAFFGTLAGYDQHMNVVLSAPAPESDGPSELDVETVEDTTIIRGDNVVTIRA
jgi:small nuclear ribonucleoprotein